MTTLAKHLPAIFVLAIASGFLGALVAIGGITGKYAVTVFLAVLTGVGTLIGMKIGATATTTTAAKKAET